jgi:cytochrome c553
MKTLRPLVIAALLAVTTASAQVVVQPKATGIESGAYVWNEVTGEALTALRIKGDKARGLEAYRVCHGCHRAGALGSADGVYPRLAGQHDTVVIKQLVDVRTGRRDNPKMYPFASEHGITTQEIADLAAYLAALPSPPDNGKGDGATLASGKSLYARDCVRCHGRSGEGDAKRFYPRVAGQHYQYLLRQVREIAGGERRNANPAMAEVVRNYSEADAAAVADFMSRLTLDRPGRKH